MQSVSRNCKGKSTAKVNNIVVASTNLPRERVLWDAVFAPGVSKQAGGLVMRIMTRLVLYGIDTLCRRAAPVANPARARSAVEAELTHARLAILRRDPLVRIRVRDRVRVRV